MAEADSKRLGALEDELKLLKGEGKRTLVDLRAFIMREDSPLNDKAGGGGGGGGGISREAGDKLNLEVGQATQRVDTLEEELRALIDREWSAR